MDKSNNPITQNSRIKMAKKNNQFFLLHIINAPVLELVCKGIPQIPKLCDFRLKFRGRQVYKKHFSICRGCIIIFLVNILISQVFEIVSFIHYQKGFTTHYSLTKYDKTFRVKIIRSFFFKSKVFLVWRASRSKMIWGWGDDPPPQYYYNSPTVYSCCVYPLPLPC